MEKEAFQYKLNPTFFSFMECMLNTQLSQAKKYWVLAVKAILKKCIFWMGEGEMNAFGSLGFKKKILNNFGSHVQCMYTKLDFIV